MNAGTWGLIAVGALELIGVIVTAVLSLKGQKEQAAASQKEMMAELDKRSELADADMKAKLDSLEKLTSQKFETLTHELREYTQVARDVPVLKEQMKTVLHRLEFLEKQKM